MVHDFKYNRRLHLRLQLARWLDQALDDPRLADQHFDLVVPVPLHPARKRERGFNQAEVLARELSRFRGLSLGKALDRIRYTTTQTQFDRTERMENLKDAFRLRHGCNVQGLRMLLVDDVLTTGSTLSECASVLKQGGARSVYAVTVARG
jgi:ComF family protein